MKLLDHISKCSDDQCASLTKGLSDEVIRTMAHICVNIMNKNIPLRSEESVKRLTPYKKQLKAITKPKTSIQKKRRIFEQKGGFLSALLGLALPLLKGIFGGFH